MFGSRRIGLPVIFALALGCCSISKGYEGAAKMTIYYVPFDIETLTPITSTNIQERGRRCEIHNLKNIDKIKDIFLGATKPPTQKLSEGRARVKLLEPSDAREDLSAVVAKDGGVWFSDGSEGSISQKGVESLKNIIERQCKP